MTRARALSSLALCRECDVLLWRAHETCPSCSARRPVLAVRVLPAHRSRHAAAAGVAAAVLALPALLAVDRLLLQILAT